MNLKSLKNNLLGGTKVFDGATLSLPILLDRPQYEVSADMSSGQNPGGREGGAVVWWGCKQLNK